MSDPRIDWLCIREKSHRFYHAILALENGRIATVCGRGFDFPHDVAGDPADKGARCVACQRRLKYTPYLIPRGAELEELLESQQLQLTMGARS